MAFELSLFSGALSAEQAIRDVMKCNDVTGKYGLLLTEAQARALAETRFSSLKGNGRIEFGSGIIDKIIIVFCDSPYLSAHNYEETLHELIEIFYSYKNETMDLVSDDDLIQYMKNAFDGMCQGSLEMLSEWALEKFARKLRYGYDPDDSDEDIESDEEDEYGEY